MDFVDQAVVTLFNRDANLIAAGFAQLYAERATNQTDFPYCILENNEATGPQRQQTTSTSIIWYQQVQLSIFARTKTLCSTYVKLVRQCFPEDVELALPESGLNYLKMRLMGSALMVPPDSPKVWMASMLFDCEFSEPRHPHTPA